VTLRIRCVSPFVAAVYFPFTLIPFPPRRCRIYWLGARAQNGRTLPENYYTSKLQRSLLLGLVLSTGFVPDWSSLCPAIAVVAVSARDPFRASSGLVGPSTNVWSHFSSGTAAISALPEQHSVAVAAAGAPLFYLSACCNKSDLLTAPVTDNSSCSQQHLYRAETVTVCSTVPSALPCQKPQQEKPTHNT
jgi:hypothetical protein